jgi:hypothetical protein
MELGNIGEYLPHERIYPWGVIEGIIKPKL